MGDVETVNESWIIYGMIQEYIKNIKFTLRSKILDEKMYKNIAMNTNHIELDCSPTTGALRSKDLIIIIITTTGEHSPIRKTPIMEKILDIITIQEKDGLVVIPDELSKHVSSKIGDIIKKSKTHIDILHFMNFSCNIPQHVFTCEHIILSSEEAQQVLTDLKIESFANLPGIKSSDTQIIWVGGRAGEIVKIKRPSETAISSIVYRRIIE